MASISVVMMLTCSRTKSRAPKPNKNFLRNIIRQTDNHNAALQARETEESHARLREMNRARILGKRTEEAKKDRKADGRLTPVLGDERHTLASCSQILCDGRCGRIEQSEDSLPQWHRRHSRSWEPQSRKHRSRSSSRSRETRHRKRMRDDTDDERISRHSKRSRHRERHHQDDYDSEDERGRSRRKHKSNHKHRTRRSSSHSSSLSRSPSSHSERGERKRRHRDHPRTRSPKSSSRHHRSERATQALYKPGKSKRPSPTLAYDSDPLEAILGPLPAHVEPAVRSRGRGAHKANSMGMDSRFSSTYDPVIDVQPPSDVEDDWGQSVEAFRDRMRWKQQGAERLRAAGFTDDQVRKWEKGDNKDEDDVTWKKRGQAREWDRGKVVDEDGDFELKAEWGRLT